MREYVSAILRMLRLSFLEILGILSISGAASMLMAIGLKGMTSLIHRIGKVSGDLLSLEFGEKTLQKLPVLESLSPQLTAALVITLPVLLFSLGSILSMVPGRRLRRRFEAVKLELKTQLFSQLMESEELSRDKKSAHTTYQLLKDHASTVESAFTSMLTTLQGSIRSIAFVAAMAHMSVQVAGFAIIITFGPMLLQWLRSRLSSSSATQTTAPESDPSSEMQELAASLAATQIWGAETKARTRFNETSLYVGRSHLKRVNEHYGIVGKSGSEIILSLKNIFVTLVSKAALIKSGAKLVMIVGVQSQFQKSVSRLGEVREAFDHSSEALKALTSALNSGTSRPSQRSRQALSFRRSLELKDVTLVPPGTDLKVLKKVSLTIRPGETHAIIGRTGAGKTSLLDLLARLSAPSSGKIILDDVSLDESNLHEYRNLIAYVPQSPTYLDGTLWRNLTYGSRTEKSESEVMRVLEGVQLLPWLQRGKYSLQTRLGRSGVVPSSGEAQRLEIARALLSTPEILIMDEATGHLDPEAQKSVMEFVHRYIAGKTLIFVTHRPETLKFAKTLHTMHNGKIKSQGLES